MNDALQSNSCQSLVATFVQSFYNLFSKSPVQAIFI